MRTLTFLLLLLVMLSGCSGSGSAEPPGRCDPATGSAPAGCSAEAICDSPALTDTSVATAVVGTGTPASCTESALAAAVAGGGIVTFDCGAEPVTIELSEPIVVQVETVIDGAGRVTLSGGGRTRILYLDSAYDLSTPRLTVQRLTFRDGRSVAGGDDTAVGGGAIYRDGDSLTVLDSTFIDNEAPLTGQDIAGGAIYGFGGGDIVIAGSVFSGNRASNGGAVGSLNGDLTVINTTFLDNEATGSGGNPGDGGCGGAIYQDGADEVTSACGVTVRNNRAGAIGGGWFRVSNFDNGTMRMERSTVDANRVTPMDAGNAGGMYLQGLDLAITDSTISRNEAFYNGGLWLLENAAVLTNVTIAENTAFGSNGGGIWATSNRSVRLRNVTLARNRSTAKDQIAGAIFGTGLTLENTLVADNSAMWSGECNEVHAGGGNNLQWPADSKCTAAPLVADPLLGALGDNGGPTETIAPAAESPARGLGIGCPATDQRGEPRADRCTVGAVELP